MEILQSFGELVGASQGEGVVFIWELEPDGLIGADLDREIQKSFILL